MTDAEFVDVLVFLNSRVEEDFRAGRDELENLVVDIPQERFRIPEYYRGRIRVIAESKEFRRREATPDELAAILAIDRERARKYKKFSGAWGTPRRIVLDPEEAAFRATATRPPEYADVINAALAEGYDPPCLPPDYWPRYMECRRARMLGRSWTDGRLSIDKMRNDYAVDELPPTVFRQTGARPFDDE